MSSCLIRNFATCKGTENILKCDDNDSELITPEDLDCYKMERGCLFNLQSDPCELVNVGNDHKKMVDQMIARLDEFELNAVTPLIEESESLDREQYDPQYQCDSDFFCPFMEYEDVPFEDTLTADYRRLFGDELSAESEDRARAEFPAESHSKDSQFADWNVLNIEMGNGHSEWRIVLVLCLLMTMSIICMVHINGLYAGSQRKETERKVRRETAPLL